MKIITSSNSTFLHHHQVSLITLMGFFYSNCVVEKICSMPSGQAQQKLSAELFLFFQGQPRFARTRRVHSECVCLFFSIFFLSFSLSQSREHRRSMRNVCLSTLQDHSEASVMKKKLVMAIARKGMASSASPTLKLQTVETNTHSLASDCHQYADDHQ